MPTRRWSVFNRSPDAQRCRLISIQGLHRFYRGRGNEVVASWMTSQSRMFAMADNISYVGSVIERVLAERKVKPPLLFAGFSQGVSMAFRAAINSTALPAAVVAVGGDVPPEMAPAMLKRLSGAMLCRGVSDPVYSNEKFREDEARLIGAGVKARALEYDGDTRGRGNWMESCRALCASASPIQQQIDAGKHGRTLGSILWDDICPVLCRSHNRRLALGLVRQ